MKFRYHLIETLRLLMVGKQFKTSGIKFYLVLFPTHFTT